MLFFIQIVLRELINSCLYTFLECLYANHGKLKERSFRENIGGKYSKNTSKQVDWVIIFLKKTRRGSYQEQKYKPNPLQKYLILPDREVISFLYFLFL